MATKTKRVIVIIIVSCVLCILAHRACIAEQQADVEIAKFHSEYPVGSDGYCIDSIMYEHPSWSYDQAEEYLFGK